MKILVGMMKRKLEINRKLGVMLVNGLALRQKFGDKLVIEPKRGLIPTTFLGLKPKRGQISTPCVGLLAFECKTWWKLNYLDKGNCWRKGLELMIWLLLKIGKGAWMSWSDHPLWKTNKSQPAFARVEIKFEMWHVIPTQKAGASYSICQHLASFENWY